MRKFRLTPWTRGAAQGQKGVSLPELLMFIMIVSIALSGVVSVYAVAVSASANPMVRKQALSLAEALLAEIEQQPFTWCDPNDALVTTAASAAGCTGGVPASQDPGAAGLSGPMPSGEIRGDATNPFDNVADYAGFQMGTVNGTPLSALDDITTSVLAGYSASVAITRSGASFSLPNDAVLRIAVRVWNGTADITLVGYRFRYAPNL